jgi:Na+-translocating ferredoxin:NAD+ oxidoreductase RnfG subunit
MEFTKKIVKTSIFAAALSAVTLPAYSKNYITIQQAKEIMFGDEKMSKTDIILTKQQMKSIAKASKTRVRNKKMQVWKTSSGGWFIVDNVIGKHENIDIAVSIDNKGKLKSVEILTYRETYGYQIMNPKWLAQFIGKDKSQHLKLDKQIKNISGATLSCRHVTDGVNRLNHTWDQVLRYL